MPENVAIPIEYKVAEKADEMDSILEENNLYTFPPTGDYSERAVFVRTNNPVVLTFINHIRNSIAHGRFNIVGNGRDNTIVLEDNNKYNKCSARIIVKSRTLENWIDELTSS